MVVRYFIEISFLGKNYFGWQKQPKSITIQETLEKALSTILRTDIAITGAGRTDTGVHAQQMFAHFDTSKSLNVDALAFKLNSFLPPDIAIKAINKVSEEAHARFDAISRSYQYFITTHKNPFLEETAYYFKRNLSLKNMNEAAQLLLTHNDFQCFSRSKTDVKTYLCNITEAYWENNGNNLIFNITANRFLRNMVRAIVGTLLQVGEGKLTLLQFKAVLESKQRSKAGASVPAKGLFLVRVTYPEQLFLKI